MITTILKGIWDFFANLIGLVTAIFDFIANLAQEIYNIFVFAVKCIAWLLSLVPAIPALFAIPIGVVLSIRLVKTLRGD